MSTIKVRALVVGGPCAGRTVVVSREARLVDLNHYSEAGLFDQVPDDKRPDRRTVSYRLHRFNHQDDAGEVFVLLPMGKDPLDAMREVSAAYCNAVGAH